MWVIETLNEEEIDRWIAQREFGVDSAVFEELRSDIHALVRKACDTANVQRGERDRAIILLSRLDELADMRKNLKLSDYYRWHRQKLWHESSAGGTRHPPSPEDRIEGFIKLYRAAMNA